MFNFPVLKYLNKLTFKKVIGSKCIFRRIFIKILQIYIKFDLIFVML